MFLRSKILFLFNKFFINFIKDLKASDDELKTTLKKHYKVIDKSSSDYITLFWTGLSKYSELISSSEIKDLESNEELGGVEIVTGLKVSEILKALSDDTKKVFWNYIYTLSVFSILYNDNSDDEVDNVEASTSVEGVSDDAGDNNDKEDDEASLKDMVNEALEENDKENQNVAIFNKVVEVLGAIQKGSVNPEIFDDIMDDEVRGLLMKIKSLEAQSKVDGMEKESGEGIDFGSMFGNIGQSSKIANLAKEISDEIDINNLKIEKPEDIMKMMDFSGGNNVMGDIIKKVSSKITDKISSGELKHDELLNEAMGMMGMMGKGMGGLGGLGGLGDLLNNPMVNELMKNMKKGKPMQTKTDVVSKQNTRDRLRKKLEERRNKTEN